MARLTEEEKMKAQADYEARSMGVREIARKYGVSPSTVRNWREKGQWEQGKTAHLVEKKKKAIKDLHETEQQTAHLPAHQQIAIDNEVQRQLEAEEIFTKSAKFNQSLANRIINTSRDVKLADLDVHSRLTARNKETVLGKNPDTAIQINNDKPSEIKRVIVDPKS